MDAQLSNILSQPDYTGLTAAECRTRLGETVVVSTDPTAYTWSGTNKRLGEMGLAANIRAVWDTVVTQFPGGSMLANMLGSGGVDYSREDIQEQLTATLTTVTNSPVPDDEAEATKRSIAIAVLTALLAIGVSRGPRWQQEGLAELPTEAAVVAARDVNAGVAFFEARVNEWNEANARMKSAIEAGGGLAEVTAAWEGE